MSEKFQLTSSSAILVVGTSLVAGILMVVWPYTPPNNVTATTDIPAILTYDRAHPIRAIGALQSTRDKPLFSHERKPGAIDLVQDIAPETEVLSEEVVSVEEFELKGTLEKGGEMLALIKWSGAPSGVWLAPGSDLEHWVIDEVNLDHILLRSEDTVAKVSLFPGIDQPQQDLEASE